MEPILKDSDSNRMPRKYISSSKGCRMIVPMPMATINPAVEETGPTARFFAKA
jgi:hypothetical protein